MEKKKFRHELKYHINVSDYFSLRSRLNRIMLRDGNGGTSGKYKIRSLYFDNFDEKALKDKINGLNIREKFRIRYYNDNPVFIKLEKKSKINGLCSKSATIISREQVEKLLNKDVDWMMESGDPLLVELYAKMKYQLLRPKTIVDYYREAFLYFPGNVRVTIDSDIRSSGLSRDFFKPDLATLAITKPGQIILEVKYDEVLPEPIRDILQTNERQYSAISKYAASRIYG